VRGALDERLQQRIRRLSGREREPDHRSHHRLSGFDLVLVANVTHLETAARNRDLFERLRRSLRRSGEIAYWRGGSAEHWTNPSTRTVVIIDLVFNPEARKP
jgi:hypothetical protein